MFLTVIILKGALNAWKIVPVKVKQRPSGCTEKMEWGWWGGSDPLFHLND